MKCRRAKALIFDFIDGIIREQDRLGLEQHLGECRECERVANGLRQSLDALHRLEPEAPDANFTWNVRLRINKERNALSDAAASHRHWLLAWNRRFALSAVTAFAVVAAAGFMISRSLEVPGIQSTHPDVLAKQEATKVPENTTTRYGAQPTAETLGSTSTGGPILSFVSEGVPLLRSTKTGFEPFENESGPVLDVDSLQTLFLQNLAAGYRARQLQQQVRLLQDRLIECEAAGSKKN
jgi:hypothetical protein